jgi:hypothetical protein
MEEKRYEKCVELGIFIFLTFNRNIIESIFYYYKKKRSFFIFIAQIFRKAFDVRENIDFVWRTRNAICDKMLAALAMFFMRRRKFKLQFIGIGLIK